MTEPTKIQLVEVFSHHIEGYLMNFPQDAKDALQQEEDWEDVDQRTRALYEAFVKAEFPKRIDENVISVELNGTKYFVTVETEFERDMRNHFEELGDNVVDASDYYLSLSTDELNHKCDRNYTPTDHPYDMILEYLSESLHQGEEPTLKDFRTYVQEYPDHDNEEKLAATMKWLEDATEEMWHEQATMAIGEYEDMTASS